MVLDENDNCLVYSPFDLWGSILNKEGEEEGGCDNNYSSLLASFALECLIKEEGSEEIIMKRCKNAKKEEKDQNREKMKRKRSNLTEPGGPFYCDSPGCGKFYCRRRELNRHKRYSCLNPPQFQCEFCPLRTAQRYNLVTHKRLKHGDQCFIGHITI